MRMVIPLQTFLEENDLFADDFEELAENDLEKRRVGAARLNSQSAVPAGSSESRGQQKSKSSLRGHFGKRYPLNNAELDGEFDDEYENVKRASSLRGKYGKRAGSLRGKYGKRAGSLRGKYGKRAGGLRGKYGKRAGSLRGKYGKRAGSLRGKYGR